MTTKNICIFGDSIAYGEWGRENGWADRLRMALQGETLDSQFQSYYFLYNLSIPGDTTRDILARFDAECAVRDPHIVIFAVGINDASCRGDQDTPRVAFPAFEENVRILIARAKEKAAVVAWTGLTRVDEARTMPFETTYFFNERIARYDAAIRRICAETGAVYGEVADALEPDDLADGLHPNDRGSRKLFSLLNTKLPVR